jgi:SAM-dependent methyltransferase
VRFKEIADLCKGTVLDIGCGECELKKYLPGDCQYTGVDLAPSEHVIQGSAYKLDFNDRSFDTTLLLNVLEHLENPLLALTEIRRVTKGQLILCVPNPFNTDQIASILHNGINIENTNHINLFGDNEIRNLCFNAGFDNVRPVRFYTKVPGLNWLSPIRSCFGQWAIYVVT